MWLDCPFKGNKRISKLFDLTQQCQRHLRVRLTKRCFCSMNDIPEGVMTLLCFKSISLLHLNLAGSITVHTFGSTKSMTPWIWLSSVSMTQTNKMTDMPARSLLFAIQLLGFRGYQRSRANFLVKNEIGLKSHERVPGVNYRCHIVRGKWVSLHMYACTVKRVDSFQYCLQGNWWKYQFCR
jgi:hypothetical protein